MSIHDDREAPIYHLLSNYNSEALTHGAWLASFIISIFTFMGLSLSCEDPRWGLGSFSILFLLCFLSSYVFGRLIYYTKLVSCLLGNPIVEPFPTPIRDVNRKVEELFEDKVKESGWRSFWWFAGQFRRSFCLSSVFWSLVLGIVVAAILHFLGLVYLDELGWLLNLFQQ